MPPSNPLPINGNEKTMNLNHLILTNIQSSPYFKVNLYELKTYHEVIDEIYYKVDHLEPWEKGSRKTAGQTGMCGGVRGVGAGGIVSSAYCLLYKLFTLKLTRKQLNGLITHTDSPYIRGLGFMYIRYTQPPSDLWDWYGGYLEDDEELDVKAGGGQMMSIGELARQWLVKIEWYSTLFPRIPVPVQKTIQMRLRDYDAQHHHHIPMVAEEPVEEFVQGEEGYAAVAEPAVAGEEGPHYGEAERQARMQGGSDREPEQERNRDRERADRERVRGERKKDGDRERDREKDRREGEERSRDSHRGDRERDHGDREKDRGDREKDRGDREKDRGDWEKDRGDREKDRGDREKDRGDREKDRGDREKDRGDREKDRGDREKDRGDREKDRGDREKDRGDRPHHSGSYDFSKEIMREKERQRKEKERGSREKDHAGSSSDRGSREHDRNGRDRYREDRLRERQYQDTKVWDRRDLSPARERKARTPERGRDSYRDSRELQQDLRDRRDKDQDRDRDRDRHERKRTRSNSRDQKRGGSEERKRSKSPEVHREKKKHKHKHKSKNVDKEHSKSKRDREEYRNGR